MQCFLLYRESDLFDLITRGAHTSTTYLNGTRVAGPTMLSGVAQDASISNHPNSLLFLSHSVPETFKKSWQ